MIKSEKKRINVLFSDVKGLVKRLDRICKFGQPDNEKGREAYFYLE